MKIVVLGGAGLMGRIAVKDLVSSADVDNMLEKLRKQRVTWTKVERPSAQGDRLEIDFEGSIDGQSFSGNSAKNVPLELGSGAMIPGFEEQLTGSSAGERKTIEVTFPQDYASKEVAGKTAQFEVSVNAVAEAVLPELNDDFAKTFGVGKRLCRCRDRPQPLRARGQKAHFSGSADC